YSIHKHPSHTHCYPHSLHDALPISIFTNKICTKKLMTINTSKKPILPGITNSISLGMFEAVNNIIAHLPLLVHAHLPSFLQQQWLNSATKLLFLHPYLQREA